MSPPLPSPPAPLLPPPFWPRAVLHLDMDAFFVNVHVADHPEDKEIPLAVGGRPDRRGVVSSASYAARRLGIRSAMPSSQAVRLCPELKIVSANWPRIREFSKAVMAVLETFGPLEQMSVDEAYVDLIEQFNQANSPDPVELAQGIRTAVKQKTGLPASVGLATNKLVAKVASDFNKPEGCKIILPGNEATFLAPLSTRVIWGIGPRTYERLAKIGIQTCGQLAAANFNSLQRTFGRQAAELKQRAMGQDNRPVQKSRGPAKSISQEWTFNNDINDPDILKKKLHKMSLSVAKSVKKRELVAQTIIVKFRWSDFTTFTRQKSLSVGVDDGEAIYRIAKSIWEENWPVGTRVRLLGVGVSNLKKVTVRQLGFSFD